MTRPGSRYGVRGKMTLPRATQPVQFQAGGSVETADAIRSGCWTAWVPSTACVQAMYPLGDVPLGDVGKTKSVPERRSGK